MVIVACLCVLAAPSKQTITIVAISGGALGGVVVLIGVGVLVYQLRLRSINNSAKQARLQDSTTVTKSTRDLRVRSMRGNDAVKPHTTSTIELRSVVVQNPLRQ